MSTTPVRTGRRTQAERRAQTRSALLEAAARGFSTHGYSSLVLGDVAKEAGYTRGALYHLFPGKEGLALAVVEWIEETWTTEVGEPAADEADPLAALLAIAHGHLRFCRRDVARALVSLRVEFASQDRPVGREIFRIVERLDAQCAELITAGRAEGAIPPGPPASVLAAAFTAIIEAVGIELADHEADGVEVVDRAVRGLLGVAAVPPGGEPAASV